MQKSVRANAIIYLTL